MTENQKIAKTANHNELNSRQVLPVDLIQELVHIPSALLHITLEKLKVLIIKLFPHLTEEDKLLLQDFLQNQGSKIEVSLPLKQLVPSLYVKELAQTLQQVHLQSGFEIDSKALQEMLKRFIYQNPHDLSLIISNKGIGLAAHKPNGAVSYTAQTIGKIMDDSNGDLKKDIRHEH